MNITSENPKKEEIKKKWLKRETVLRWAHDIATVTLTEADLHHKLTLTGSVDTVKQKNGADETEPSADPNLHHLNR